MWPLWLCCKGPKWQRWDAQQRPLSAPSTTAILSFPFHCLAYLYTKMTRSEQQQALQAFALAPVGFAFSSSAPNFLPSSKALRSKQRSFANGQSVSLLGGAFNSAQPVVGAQSTPAQFTTRRSAQAKRVLVPGRCSRVVPFASLSLTLASVTATQAKPAAAATTAPTKKKKSLGEILEYAGKRALSGGIPGMVAMGLQVLTLMCKCGFITATQTAPQQRMALYPDRCQLLSSALRIGRLQNECACVFVCISG